jgi:hypothetical protein
MHQYEMNGVYTRQMHSLFGHFISGHLPSLSLTSSMAVTAFVHLLVQVMTSIINWYPCERVGILIASEVQLLLVLRLAEYKASDDELLLFWIKTVRLSDHAETPCNNM